MTKKRINACTKGKRYERHVSKRLTELLHVKCRRGQQYSGIGGADVVGLRGIHIEAKHDERLQIHDAIDQSVRDAGDDIPVVVHKKNRRHELLTIRLDDLQRFVKAIVALDPFDRVNAALTELGEMWNAAGTGGVGDVDGTDWLNIPTELTPHDQQRVARTVQILRGER